MDRELCGMDGWMDRAEDSLQGRLDKVWCVGQAPCLDGRTAQGWTDTWHGALCTSALLLVTAPRRPQATDPPTGHLQQHPPHHHSPVSCLQQLPGHCYHPTKPQPQPGHHLLYVRPSSASVSPIPCLGPFVPPPQCLTTLPPEVCPYSHGGLPHWSYGAAGASSGHQTPQVWGRTVRGQVLVCVQGSAPADGPKMGGTDPRLTPSLHGAPSATIPGIPSLPTSGPVSHHSDHIWAPLQEHSRGLI